MNRVDFINTYWNYYLMLENEFRNITQYVSIREHNYSTCSDEIIKLTEVVGSECDLILKRICDIDLNDKSATMKQYSKLLDVYPNIVNEKVKILYTNIILQPFKNWYKEKPWELTWWKAYNEIKHNREENYEKGNFEILLNSLGALHYLEMYFCRKIGHDTYDIDVPNVESKFFSIVDWKTNPIRKTIILEKDVHENGVYDIQIPYIVGSGELEIYLGNYRLLQATKENAPLDGNYMEVGNYGETSHYFQLVSDACLKKGDVIYIQIKQKYR